jgi:hypothetical protein
MNFQTEIETLIRARYPILYLITSEELRVQNLLVEIAARRQKKVFEWTYSNGIVPAGTSIQSQKSRNVATKDPLAALDQVIEQVEPAIFLFKDFHPFLSKNNFEGHRAAFEEQLQNHHPDFAGDGNPGGTGQGNHRPQLPAAHQGRSRRDAR